MWYIINFVLYYSFNICENVCCCTVLVSDSNRLLMQFYCILCKFCLLLRREWEVEGSVLDSSREYYSYILSPEFYHFIFKLKGSAYCYHTCLFFQNSS